MVDYKSKELDTFFPRLEFLKKRHCFLIIFLTSCEKSYVPFRRHINTRRKVHSIKLIALGHSPAQCSQSVPQSVTKVDLAQAVLFTRCRTLAWVPSSSIIRHKRWWQTFLRAMAQDNSSWGRVCESWWVGDTGNTPHWWERPSHCSRRLHPEQDIGLDSLHE